MSKTKFITNLYEGIGDSKAAKEAIRKLKKAVSDNVIDIKKFNSIVKTARTRQNPLNSIKNAANKIGQASTKTANKAPTVVPKTAPDLAGLAKTALATTVALGIAKFSGGDKKETSTTTSGKDRANRPLLPTGQNKAGEKGTSTVSEKQRVDASKAAKERAKKRKIDSLGQNTGKLSKPPVPNKKPKPPKDYSMSEEQRKSPRKVEKEKREAKRDKILKEQGDRQQGQLPKKSPKKKGRFEQGIKEYKTPFGTLTVDSTDRGMSKFMGTDKEIAEQEMEEEMNFRRGGMPRSRAFGKGGMYKTPKKAYGMKYGGVTRRLKG